ncbi:hypothetical protein HK104_005866 [Borealophlyctis nickersoniae]|nr:hypothetical protein HK104_005866 [Borealophlyctis nickersoniae]
MPRPKFNLQQKWDIRQSLMKARDTRNFVIEKPGRFGARFFQIFCSVASWYFLGKQDDTLITPHGLWPTFHAMTFFAIISPIISALLIAVHIFPWFSKSWTSRRIMILETISDFFIGLGWFGGFVAGLSKMNGDCPPNASSACNLFNWALAWFFFSFLFFGAGFVFDVRTWYKAIWAPQEIDAEVLLDVRRSTRIRK